VTRAIDRELKKSSVELLIFIRSQIGGGPECIEAGGLQTALASSLLTAAYHMLKSGTLYQDLGAASVRPSPESLPPPGVSLADNQQWR
jgi:hypothetical protein